MSIGFLKDKEDMATEKPGCWLVSFPIPYKRRLWKMMFLSNSGCIFRLQLSHRSHRWRCSKWSGRVRPWKKLGSITYLEIPTWFGDLRNPGYRKPQKFPQVPNWPDTRNVIPRSQNLLQMADLMAIKLVFATPRAINIYIYTYTYTYIYIYIPSRELTYPTLGKGKSSSNMPWMGIC